MTAFINLFVDLWKQIINLLSNTAIELGGYTVSLFSVLLVMVIIGFVISVFWRGAKA